MTDEEWVEAVGRRARVAHRVLHALAKGLKQAQPFQTAPAMGGALATSVQGGFPGLQDQGGEQVLQILHHPNVVPAVVHFTGHHLDAAFVQHPLPPTDLETALPRQGTKVNFSPLFGPVPGSVEMFG